MIDYDDTYPHTFHPGDDEDSTPPVPPHQEESDAGA